MNPWELPREASIGDQKYPHVTDFRQILRILRLLNGPEHPGFRWLKALAVFFPGEMPPIPQAMTYLSEFLNGCQTEPTPSRPGLLDWETDAREILEGVNTVAGCDIREKAHLHWWTFLSLFHSIREGALSDLVAIRQKRQTGKPLTEEEKAFITQNPHKFRPKESEADRQHRERLERMLNAECGM